jgi:hypothetical protein
MNAFENALLNGLPLADAAAFHVQLLGYDRPKLATAGGMAPPALPATATGQQMPAPAPITLPNTAMGSNTVKAAGLFSKKPPAPAPHLAKYEAAGYSPSAEVWKKGFGLNDHDAASMKEDWHKIRKQMTDAGQLHDLRDFHEAFYKAEHATKTAATDKSPEEVGKERARASLSAEHEKAQAHKREHGGGLVGSLTGAALGGAAAHHYGKGNPLGTIAGIMAGHHIAGKTGREVGAVMDQRAHEKNAADMSKLGAAVKRAFEGVQNAGMGMGASSPVDPQQAAQALDQPPAKPVPVQPALDEATQQYLQLQQAQAEATDASAVQFYQQKLEELKAQMEQATQENQQLQQEQAAHEAELAQIQAQVADSTQKAMTASDQVLKEQQGAAAMRMAYQQLRGQILNTVSSDPPMMSSDQAAMAAASTGQAGAAPGGATPDGGATPAPAGAGGPAGQAPAPGTPPGSPAPEGDPTVPNADGIAMSKPMMDTAQPATAVGQKDQQKVGSAVSAAFKELKSRAPHAAAGAVLGAATGAAEAHHSGKGMKERHDKLEAKSDRSYSETKALGKAKGKMLLSDYAKEHPGKFTGMSALAGGALGGAVGPDIVRGLKHIRENVSAARVAKGAE